MALTVNLGTFTIRPSPVGTRHQPPIHRLAGNCNIHVLLPCTPQPLFTESSVFHGKAIQHAVIPVISFTWSSSTPSANKIYTFTESFDDAIDSVAMETKFSGLYSDINIHSANILQLFQPYIVSQDAPLSPEYVEKV